MRKKRLISLSESSGEDGTINLTPLIDVVFVVLIMFIIVVPLLEMDRVELASSIRHENKDKSQIQENSPIKIYVHENNSITFNSNYVTTDQLIELLKTAKRQSPHRVPQLFQDKKAQFGTYQSVKNAVELAGFDELDVILKPG
ncbi:MAG TPA: biopolymer transporter ExbD [Rhabdochlamydiaceae bacterium]|nr:biopolymer transporter ExbD [Rhabdochlamydiaceae bacterium]